MSREMACEALRQGRRIAFTYKGLPRVAEVHAVGNSTAGNDVMRVYQTSGQSTSGSIPDWRLMTIDNVGGMSITGEASNAPRPKYSPGDKAMAVIYCEI